MDQQKKCVGWKDETDGLVLDRWINRWIKGRNGWDR